MENWLQKGKERKEKKRKGKIGVWYCSCVNSVGVLCGFILCGWLFCGSAGWVGVDFVR